MRSLLLFLLVGLSSCVRSPGSPPVLEEDTSIRFPDFYDRAAVLVGGEGGLYDVDGVTLRALLVALNDFLPPSAKERTCRERPESHRYRVIRREEIVFVEIYEDPQACQGALPGMDAGVKYAIRTDGRILRRLYAGEPEGGPTAPSPDAGGHGPEYEVDPSKVGLSNTPPDPKMMEWMERLGGQTPSTPSLQVDGGTPPTPPQDGGAPPAP